MNKIIIIPLHQILSQKKKKKKKKKINKNKLYQ